jgi:iron(III) transport system substrate-binding protein
MQRAPTLGVIAATLVVFTLTLGGTIAGAADEPVLNLYSARHYQTDEALYENFTKATGIRINRIEAGDEQLLERIRSEGAMSPADVLLIVDAARLWSAQQELFQPVKRRLEDRFRRRCATRMATGTASPPCARHHHNKATVTRLVATYESLAEPKQKGKVCTRSGSHPYNLSLVAALIAHNGEAKTEEWARGVVANMARTPRGGDTDQIKALPPANGAAPQPYYYVLPFGQARGREWAAKAGPRS